MSFDTVVLGRLRLPLLQLQPLLLVILPLHLVALHTCTVSRNSLPLHSLQKERKEKKVNRFLSFCVHFADLTADNPLRNTINELRIILCPKRVKSKLELRITLCSKRVKSELELSILNLLFRIIFRKPTFDSKLTCENFWMLFFFFFFDEAFFIFNFYPLSTEICIQFFAKTLYSKSLLTTLSSIVTFFPPPP